MAWNTSSKYIRKLREKGLTYREIGELCGISGCYARQIFLYGEPCYCRNRPAHIGKRKSGKYAKKHNKIE